MIKRVYSKYKNVWTVYNGVKYQSKAEADYAKYLDSLLLNGVINNWDRQIIFKLEIDGVKICSYILDFKIEYPDRIDFVDIKGSKSTITDTFKIKQKLMKALHNTDVKVIFKKDIPK